MKTRLNDLNHGQLVEMLYDNPLHLVYSCEDFSEVKVWLCFDTHKNVDLYQENIDLNDWEDDVDFAAHSSEVNSCDREKFINWVLAAAAGNYYDIHLFTDKNESAAIKEAIEEFKEICGSVLEDGYIPTNLPK